MSNVLRSCWEFRCSGSLIGPKVVLSTVFCVYQYQQHQWKLLAGDWNLDTFEEQLPYQERLVKEIFVHPQYNHSNRDHRHRNGVTLLVLESPITNNVPFICLPPPDVNFAVTSCKMVGWDHTVETTTGSRALLEEDVSYLDHDQCQTFRQYSQLDSVLPDSEVCALVLRERPMLFNHQLICIAENHYFAHGLSSWSFNKSVYGYMDVVKFRNLIDQTMRANGFPTHTYTQRL